jgi:hypothetical protein
VGLYLKSWLRVWEYCGSSLSTVAMEQSMKLYKANLEESFEVQANSEEEARAIMYGMLIQDVLLKKDGLIIWSCEELPIDVNKGKY